MSADPQCTPGAVRRAVIDVGTNSVKLLVGDVVDGAVIPVWETSEQTRLGRGFYETHRLQAEPIAATASVVSKFAQQAQSLGAVSTRVVATSAARDASNQGELTGAIRAASGLEVEVISGDQEAAWGFGGVASGRDTAGRRLLVLDVGGGSTEFMLGRGLPHEFRQSFQLGSVRLHERFRPSDPPATAELATVRSWLQDFLGREVAPGLQRHFDAQGLPDRVLGVGGTTSILALMEHGLAQFDRDRVESTEFSRAQLSAWVDRLWSLPIEERRRIVGLPPERADVILFGTAIYEAVLVRFGLPSLGASTRGLRFAALLEPAVSGGADRG